MPVADGLALADELVEADEGELRARGRRTLGRKADAAASYARALTLTRQEPERRFLERRLAELADDGPGEDT
jgi:RNA polymerase sigma-70 factor (ECF subfamily)